MRRLLTLALALTTTATLAIELQPPRAPQPPRPTPTNPDPPKPFSVVEAGIAEMRAAMEQRRTTSLEIVHQCLTRIALYEDQLNAIITVNPHALKEADERDRERAQGKIRGPLHGIPVALKDNIHTPGMATTRRGGTQRT